MSIEQQLREYIANLRSFTYPADASRDAADALEEILAKAEAAPAAGEAVGEYLANVEPGGAIVWRHGTPQHGTKLYAGPRAVPDGKYDAVLKPFVTLMERELHANSGKGDRPGWLAMDRKTCLLEIYYHLAKLQKAAKDNDGEGIREYAADVANMSMMLVDVCGLLLAAKAEG